MFRDGGALSIPDKGFRKGSTNERSRVETKTWILGQTKRSGKLRAMARGDCLAPRSWYLGGEALRAPESAQGQKRRMTQRVERPCELRKRAEILQERKN